MTKTLKLIELTALTSGFVPAAIIVWDPVIVKTTESNIFTAGTLHVASNLAGSSDQTINGVVFTAQPSGPLGLNVSGTFYTTVFLFFVISEFSPWALVTGWP